jgi:hypothetical protein
MSHDAELGHGIVGARKPGNCQQGQRPEQRQPEQPPA